MRSLIQTIREYFAPMASFLELDSEVGQRESFVALMSLSDGEDIATAS